MSPKLVDELVPGSASFYIARSDEKCRHIHDISTSLCDISATSAWHAYEMKTRTRILNRLKFSQLLAEYLRHLETSLRHMKTFVRVPHDSWRVIASYNSQQLVVQNRDSVTGASGERVLGVSDIKEISTNMHTLYSYEADFIQPLLSTWKKQLASASYLDLLLSVWEKWSTSHFHLRQTRWF